MQIPYDNISLMVTLLGIMMTVFMSAVAVVGYLAYVNLKKTMTDELNKRMDEIQKQVIKHDEQLNIRANKRFKAQRNFSMQLDLNEENERNES